MGDSVGLSVAISPTRVVFSSFVLVARDSPLALKSPVAVRVRSSRGVAQPGSAFVWGTKGRRFKSGHSEQLTKPLTQSAVAGPSRPWGRMEPFGGLSLKPPE